VLRTGWVSARAACTSGVVRLGTPLAKRLTGRAIDVHFVGDSLDPAQRNEVVLTVRILGEPDGVGALDAIDDGEDGIVRGDDGRVRLDLIGVDHADMGQAQDVP
jgi:hypothetical protein